MNRNWALRPAVNWPNICLPNVVKDMFTQTSKLHRRKETYNSICNSDNLILKLKAYILIWFARLI